MSFIDKIRKQSLKGKKNQTKRKMRNIKYIIKGAAERGKCEQSFGQSFYNEECIEFLEKEGFQLSFEEDCFGERRMYVKW